jgi:hypothetical protein
VRDLQHAFLKRRAAEGRCAYTGTKAERGKPFETYFTPEEYAALEAAA